jgi:hypothetical protein
MSQQNKRLRMTYICPIVARSFLNFGAKHDQTEYGTRASHNSNNLHDRLIVFVIPCHCHPVSPSRLYQDRIDIIMNSTWRVFDYDEVRSQEAACWCAFSFLFFLLVPYKT